MDLECTVFNTCELKSVLCSAHWPESCCDLISWLEDHRSSESTPPIQATQLHLSEQLQYSVWQHQPKVHSLPYSTTVRYCTDMLGTVQSSNFSFQFLEMPKMSYWSSWNNIMHKTKILHRSHEMSSVWFFFGHHQTVAWPNRCKIDSVCKEFSVDNGDTFLVYVLYFYISEVVRIKKYVYRLSVV